MMVLATAYLNTPLFTFEGQAALLPRQVVAVSGSLVRTDAGGVVIEVSRYLDPQGRELEGPPRTLYLPCGKLDHVALQEA